MRRLSFGDDYHCGKVEENFHRVSSRIKKPHSCFFSMQMIHYWFEFQLREQDHFLRFWIVLIIMFQFCFQTILYFDTNIHSVVGWLDRSSSEFACFSMVLLDVWHCFRKSRQMKGVVIFRSLFGERIRPVDCYGPSCSKLYALSSLKCCHPGRNNGRNFSGIRVLTAVKISHRSRY